MSTHKKVELFGWALFTFSALFYIVSNVSSGHMLSLAGSVSFLVACGVFVTLRLSQHD